MRSVALDYHHQTARLTPQMRVMLSASIAGWIQAQPALTPRMEWRYPMARGILVFLVILLLGGGVFWALVGGCIAA
jgi:hypothetical protein